MSSSTTNSPSQGRLRLLPAERMLTSPLADLKRRSKQRRQQQPQYSHQQQQGDEEDDEENFIRRLDDQQMYSAEEEEIDWNKPTRFDANHHHKNHDYNDVPLSWKNGMGRPYRSAVLLPQVDDNNHQDLEEEGDETDEYYDTGNTSTALNDNFILRKAKRNHAHGEGESSSESPWLYSSRPSSLSRSSGYLLGLTSRMVTSSSSALVAKRASLSYHHIKNEQQQLQQNSWELQQQEQRQPQHSGPNGYCGSSSGCSTQSSCSSSFGSSLRSQMNSQHLQQTSSGSSLQAAANNFRTFAENYERGLM